MSLCLHSSVVMIVYIHPQSLAVIDRKNCDCGLGLEDKVQLCSRGEINNVTFVGHLSRR